MTEAKTNSKAKPTSCKKCDNCKCCHCREKSILPICCLVGMLTALFVTVLFLIGMMKGVLPFNGNSTYSGDFKKMTGESREIDDNGFVTLSGGAVLDMLNYAKGSGLLVVTDPTTNPDTTTVFIEKVKTAAAGASVYHYAVATDGEAADNSAYNVLVGGSADGAPTLLFVLDGAIYDRLDDANSEADIQTFVAKYR